MKNKTNRTLRKILSIALCLALIMSYVPMVSITASAAATDITVTIDTGASVTLRDADGNDYYDIGTADELYAFAAAVNGGNTVINGELTANIVVNQNVLVDGTLNSYTEGFRVWTPIGNLIKIYKGTFDGGDHTVSGLYLNNIEAEYVGLFGYVGDDGKVQNVGVIASYFNCFQDVGGVVGHNTGTVTGCYNTGTVMGCKNGGGFDTSDHIGGVVGNNYGTVTGCYNTGTVNGIDFVGGVVGDNYGTVTSCYNIGHVSGRLYVGGVVGENFGTLTGCYNIGTISGRLYVGGVVGYNSTGCTVTCCYYDNTVYTGNAIDINKGTATDVLGKTTEQFASGEVAYLLQGKQTEQVWGQNIGTDDYPVLGGEPVYYGYISSEYGADKVYTNDANASAENGHTGEATYTLTEDGKQHIAKCPHCGAEVIEEHIGGTATCQTQAVCEACEVSYGELDPNNHEYEKYNGICCGTYQSATLNAEGYYEIFNVGQLFWFAQQVNIEGNTTANAKLMADIDLENRTWYPIGLYNDIAEANGSLVQKQYAGTFDGNNYTVSNFTTIGNGSQGLFGYCDSARAQIKNLGVINATVSGWNSGAVAGYCANLTNCYAVGCTITGASDTNTSAVTISSVGGNNGPTAIVNCWAYDCELIVGEGETEFVMHPVGGIRASDDNAMNMQNCYYGEIVTNAEFTSTTGAVEKTKAQFALGEVAYLLGAAWGQDLGENGDAYPVLSGKKVYYGYTSCGDTEKKYTNDENTSEEKFAHTGGTATCQTQAVCEVCEASYGELDPNNHEYEKNNGICCDTYQSAILNADNYYEISNAGQLFWFANYINTVDRTANAVLTADIDLENRPWTPIGETNEAKNNFRGIFDGQNHTIKGLYVEGGRAGLGFFGEVRTGTVKNFTIYGEVVANTDVNYVGGVIGSICGLNGDNDLERNGAIIQNITSYVNLTAKTHGIGMIGGFVGYANHESLIENCSWYGTFDAGIYRVDSGAGGFIGKIQESTSRVTIRNCGAYGTIKTNYAKNSYNNTPTIYMGGFLSFSNTDAQTAIENCLFAGKFERGENLTDEARLGAFGTLRSVNAIKNCYYLGDDGLGAVHSDSSLKPGENIEITSVTREQLKSGEVAYLLGEAWGQMSNTEGSLPIITDNELYKVVTVGETGNYSVANVGDTNGDGTVDVIDYQALVNTILADNHEQIETASYDDIVKYDLDGDGYLDVIDAYLLHLFINGFTTVDVYAVGDYDLNGKAFEEADIFAMAEAMKSPEDLETHEKYACDINGDGKVSYDDLNTLTSMFPLYFVGEA